MIILNKSEVSDNALITAQREGVTYGPMMTGPDQWLHILFIRNSIKKKT